MSYEKDLIADKDFYYGKAFEMLVDIGAIEMCPFGHDFYYLTSKFNIFDNEDEGKIYAYATKKLKEKYGEYQDFDKFHEMIKKVLAEAGESADDCFECDKIIKE